MDFSSSSRQVKQHRRQNSRLKPADHIPGGVEKGTADSVVDQQPGQHHAAGLHPGLAAVITTWAAQFSGALALAAGTESLLALLRGQGQQWPAMGDQDPAHYEARANHNLHSCDEETKSDVPTPTGNVAVNKKQPICAARCDLCNVDLTSLEIVEEHEMGKRHKRNLQKSSETAKTCKKDKILVGGDSDHPSPKMNLNDDKTGKANSCSDNVQCDGDRVSHPANQKHSLKRRMGGVRRGKRMKTVDDDAAKEMQKPSEPKAAVVSFTCDLCKVKCCTKEGFDDHLSGKMHTSKQTPPNPKAKTTMPFRCNLCNVRCDAKEVYDDHLSGKKHKSKLKSVGSSDDQATNNKPLGLQALYPPKGSFLPQNHNAALLQKVLQQLQE